MPTSTYLHAYCRNEWMDDLRFYVIFNSISVISGRWLADNERICAIEPLLRSIRFPPQARLESGIARSVGSPRFADIITRVELRGASWKLRLKFYPIPSRASFFMIIKTKKQN